MLGDLGPEVLADFELCQCAIVNGNHVEDAFPLSIICDFVTQYECIVLVPMGDFGAVFYIDLLSVDIQAQLLSIHGHGVVAEGCRHYVCDVDVRFAIGFLFVHAETHFKLLLFLSKMEIAVACVFGVRDDACGTGLGEVVRGTPYFYGQLARFGDFVE